VYELSVHHHPSDATLLAYASGRLSEGLSLVVATHLAWCAGCLQSVEAAEAAGGVLLCDAPPADWGEELLLRTLQALDGRSAADPAPARSARTLSAPVRSVGAALELPQPLRGYLDRLGAPNWRRLGPGVQQISLIRHTSGGGTVRLLRIGPGMSMPRHGHAGLELAVVLAGAYRDEIGRFARGDIADLDEEVMHQPQADEVQGCVCLIATERPLRFESRFLRWVGPVLGF
jgi:putative transcriptional regulator